MCIKSSSRVFCILVIVAVFVFCMAVPVAVSVGEKEVKTVVVDAGHGGMDGGVSSGSGVKESDIVLLIAKALGEYLEGGGFKVVHTRKNQSALVGGRFVKKTDMQRRAEIIKKAKPSLVISLHLNSFSDKRRKGIQVFFGDESSLDFAHIAQDNLNKKFNVPDAGRNFSVLKTDKYILNESPCPAVIIECGFLSNPDDEKNLIDDIYRHRLAEGIYESVLRWAFGEGV